MSSHLRQLFCITLISGFTSCAEPASPVDHVIVGVFDNETYNLSFHAAISSSNHTNARSLSYISKHYSHRSLMEELCSLDNILFIYTISTNEVIKLLTMVTSTLNIPLFAYDTTAVSPSQRLATHELLFYMNSKPADEGTVFAKIARVSVWRQIIFVMHSSMSDDGLLESFKSVFLNSNELYTTKKLIYDSKNESIPSLLFRLNGILLSLQDIQGYLPTHYVVVLHLPYDVVLEILSDADLLFEKKRIAWLVSSAANILSSTDIKWGVVTLKQETVDITFVTESMSRILEVVNQYISTGYLVNLPSCNNVSLPPNSDWLEYLHESKLVAHHNLDYYRYSIYTSSADSTWPLIGEMSSTNHKNLSSISKNISTRKPTTLTVVTIIDKPFVSKNTPLKFEGNPYCLRPAIACLEIPASVIIAHGYSSKVVDLIFEDHAVGRAYTHRNYEMYCCEGLAMDLLQSLADQLDFNYRLYISPDGSFGAYNNVTGNWTGMVKEIMDGRADMVAASFSILSGRAEVIDFTAPYYYSGYTMMASTNETHKNNFFLFLTPFHSVVWTSFLAMATIVACLLAFFEWMSIDGMNRLRVKDARSYTLASSMKTTISLMCGNNLSSKEPQSWVAKWMQNVWGFFGIIFLSAYTANLTSFLADGPSKLVVSGLHDNALLDLKMAAPSDSAAETFVKKVRPELYDQMIQHHVTDTVEGTQQIKNGEIDVFIHDKAIIEYVTRHENFDCSLYTLGAVSSDSYGSAFPKNKYQDLRSQVSEKYIEYQHSGYIDKLDRIYFPPVRDCIEPVNQDNIQLTHTKAAGLFIVLLGFIVISFCLVGFEHILYRYLIPYAKDQPSNSFWKSRYLKFFSQRLYRAIMKDGDKTGAIVFKKFANELMRTTNALIKKTSDGKIRQVKLTFYDVVSKAYETKFNRPIEAIFLRERFPTEKQEVVKGDIKFKLRRSVIENSKILWHHSNTVNQHSDKKGRRKSSFLSKPLNLGYLSPEAVTVPGRTTLETNGYLAKTATNSPKNTPSVFENEGFSFDFDSLQYDGSDVTKL